MGLGSILRGIGRGGRRAGDDAASSLRRQRSRSLSRRRSGRRSGRRITEDRSIDTRTTEVDPGTETASSRVAEAIRRGEDRARARYADSRLSGSDSSDDGSDGLLSGGLGNIGGIGLATTGYFGYQAWSEREKRLETQAAANERTNRVDEYEEARSDILDSDLSNERKQELLNELTDQFADVAGNSGGGGGSLLGFFSNMGALEKVGTLFGLGVLLILAAKIRDGGD